MKGFHRVRRPAACALALLLALVPPLQAAPRLVLEDATLSPAEADASRALLDDVLQRLPAAWRASLDARIVVAWRNDLPAGVHGHARGKTVLLRRSLLDTWMARPAGAGTDDSATRAAQAALVHELAHLHDRAPDGGLSQDPRLLDLAGWQAGPLRFGLRLSRNAFTDRSPDRYELENPREFVAVNLEHYVLDPQYACRRPALYRYFSAHFGDTPPHAACASTLPFLEPDADPGQPPLLELDPARVYAVDYLLAEGNDQPMSRWGHSMLRLVVCAPGRAPGPDCRLDLAQHRVLSFRAFVDDVQISSWRGLTGAYPSRLFVLPLRQVVDEYTKVELRGLQSIPLRLQGDEIAQLLRRAARVHWSYDGRYRFVTNNCAVETWKLLHDGVPRLAGERLSSITPTGLLRKLARAGIADASVLDAPADALRLGYRFAPADAQYQAMYDVARDALALPWDDVRDWLDVAPARRLPWLGQGDLRATAALLVLEQAAQRREEALARDALKRRLFDRRARDAWGEDARRRLQDLLDLEGLLSRPAALLPSGYGLPQRDEREALAAETMQRTTRLREQDRRLREEARGLLPAPRRTGLDAVERNVALLGDRLRQLHRDGGGLELDQLEPLEQLDPPSASVGTPAAR